MSQIIRKILRRVLPIGAIKILMDYFWAHNDLVKKYPKCQIGTPLYLNPEYLTLEDYTRIQDGMTIISAGGNVHVSKYTAIGANCFFIPGTHIPTVGLPQWLSNLHINDVKNTIYIGEDCWIGAQTIMLNKAKVGRGSVVGARSLVTKEIPPYAVVTGSPAKLIAARFNIDQIIAHEQILYPEQERLSRAYLEDLFNTHYVGMRTLGTSEIAPEDLEKLKNARKKIGLD